MTFIIKYYGVGKRYAFGERVEATNVEEAQRMAKVVIRKNATIRTFKIEME